MAEQESSDARSEAQDADEGSGTVGRFNWSDPTVPAGDAPPNVPRWPVVLTAGLWVGWIVFLLSMVISRVADAAA